jgi:hypothetical protein
MLSLTPSRTQRSIQLSRRQIQEIEQATPNPRPNRRQGLAAVPWDDEVSAVQITVGKDLSALLKQVVEKVGGKGTRDFARGPLE